MLSTRWIGFLTLFAIVAQSLVAWCRGLSLVLLDGLPAVLHHVFENSRLSQQQVVRNLGRAEIKRGVFVCPSCLINRQLDHSDVAKIGGSGFLPA